MVVESNVFGRWGLENESAKLLKRWMTKFGARVLQCASSLLATQVWREKWGHARERSQS